MTLLELLNENNNIIVWSAKPRESCGEVYIWDQLLMLKCFFVTKNGIITDDNPFTLRLSRLPLNFEEARKEARYWHRESTSKMDPKETMLGLEDMVVGKEYFVSLERSFEDSEHVKCMEIMSHDPFTVKVFRFFSMSEEVLYDAPGIIHFVRKHLY